MTSQPQEPIKFVEKPPGPATARKWTSVADQLRARPGEWALIASKDTAGRAQNFAAAISRGTYRDFRPSGHFEAVSRNNVEIYARYTGGES